MGEVVEREREREKFMAVSESGTQTRELDQTPTWAVAGVCAVIIVISIALEKFLHRVGKVIILSEEQVKKRRNRADLDYSLNVLLCPPLRYRPFSQG